MKKFFSSKAGSLILLIAIPTGVYFTNIEVQSYLGRQAVAGTGLISVPLNAAVELAAKEDKPVLVEVSAIWCSNCRRLDDEVLADENVRREIEDGYVFSRLEYESDEGQEFLEKRNAGGFPTLWVLDSEGRTIRRLPVTFDPRQFVDDLRLSKRAVKIRSRE